MGSHFKNFNASLKSYGLCDGGYFEYPTEKGIRPSDFGRDRTLLLRNLEGFEFTFGHLDSAKEILSIHKHVMR